MAPGNRSATRSADPSEEPLSTTIVSTSGCVCAAMEARQPGRKSRLFHETTITDTLPPDPAAARPEAPAGPIGSRSMSVPARRALAEDRAIHRERPLRGAAPRESAGARQAGLPQARAQIGLRHDRAEGFRYLACRQGIDEESGVSRGFRQRRNVRGDDRGPARHRLEDRKAEPLVQGRIDEGQRSRDDGGKILVGNVPQVNDPPREPPRADHRIEGAVRPLEAADENDRDVRSLLSEAGERIEETIEVPPRM